MIIRKALKIPSYGDKEEIPRWWIVRVSDWICGSVVIQNIVDEKSVMV
jgi:hypothetical protein